MVETRYCWRIVRPTPFAAVLSGTPISVKKSASSTVFVHCPLTVLLASNTIDNASGVQPNDKGGGLRPDPPAGGRTSPRNDAEHDEAAD